MSALTNKYKPYIIITIIVVILILLGIFLSKRYRVSRAINKNELALKNSHTFQTDYCSPRLLPKTCRLPY